MNIAVSTETDKDIYFSVKEIDQAKSSALPVPGKGSLAISSRYLYGGNRPMDRTLNITGVPKELTRLATRLLEVARAVEQGEEAAAEGMPEVTLPLT